MANRIAVEFSATGDFRRLLTQIEAVNVELAKINKAYAMQGNLGKKTIGELGNIVDSHVASLKGWQSSQQTIRTSVNQMTDDIIKQRYQVNRSEGAVKGLRTAWADAGKVAEKQLRLMHSQFVGLSRDSMGNVSGRLIQPTGSMKEMVTEGERVHMQQSVFNAMLQSQSTKLVNWGKNLQWAGRQLTYGLSLPIAGVIAGIGILSFKMNEQQARLRAVYGDATAGTKELDKAVKDTTNTAQEMAKQFGVSGTETVALGADFAAAGYQGVALQKIIKATTQIQVLGETDRQSAMQASISLMNAFHLSASDLTDTFNHMNAVENQTVLTTQDMITAIPRAAAPIAQLGGSVKDLIILLTAMKSGGISAEQGSIAINRAVTSLIRPTDTAVKELEGMGVHIDNLFEKHQNDPMPILATFQDLGRQLDKLTSTQRQQAIVALFGKFQNPRITAMLNNIINRTGKVGDQVQNALNAVNSTSAQAAAVTQREIDQRMNSTSGRLKRAWATISTSLAAGGQSMLKAVTPFIEVIAKIIEALSSLPGPVKNVMTVGAILVAIVGPLTMLIGLFANFTGNIAKGILTLAKWVMGLSDVETRETILKKITDSLTFSNNEQQDSVEILTAKLQTLIGTYDALAKAELGARVSGVNFAPQVAGQTLATEEEMAATGVLPIPVKKSGMPSSSKLLKYGGMGVEDQKKLTQEVEQTNSELGKSGTLVEQTGKSTKLWGSALGRTIPTVAMLGMGVAMLKQQSDGVGHSIGGWMIALTPILFVLPNIISGIGSAITKIKALRAAQAAAAEAGAAEEGAMGLGAMAGPIGLGIGAVAVAGIAAWTIWHRHQKDVQKTNTQVLLQNKDIISSSKTLSDIVGGGWKQDTVAAKKYTAAAKEATQISQIQQWADAWKKGSAGAYKALNALKNDVPGITRFINNQVAEMQLHGLSPKSIQDSINTMLYAIGRSDLQPTFNIRNIKFKTNKQALQERINTFWSNITGLINNTAADKGFIDVHAQPIGKNLMQDLIGRPESVIQSTLKGLKDQFDRQAAPFKADLLNGLRDKSAQGQADFKKWAADMFGIDPKQTMSQIVDEMVRSVPVDKLKNALAQDWPLNNTGDMGLRKLLNLRNASNSVGQGLLAAVGAAGSFGDSETNLTDVTSFLGDTMLGSKENADALAGGLDGVGKSARQASMSLEDVTSFLSNLQSNVSSGLSNATDYVLTQFDNQTQAMDNNYDKQQQNTDRHYARQMKAADVYWNYLASQATKGYKIPKAAANDYYKNFVKGEDSTVKARNSAAKLIAKYNGESWKSEKTSIQRLKDKIAEEKKAEAERQKIFQAEMTRLQRMASLEQININYQSALAGGNLDQAAQFMAQGMAETMQNALQDASDAGQNAAQKDQARLNKRLKHINTEIQHRKDWLNNERDANHRALEDDKRTADRRIAANKKLMDELRSQRRTELEQELNDLTLMVPKNAKQMQNMFDSISAEAGKFGVGLSDQAGTWSHLVTDTWSRSVRESRDQVKNDNAWTKMGKSIADQVSQGEVGMNWNSFVRWMITGKLPKQETNAVPSQKWMKNNKPANMSMDNWQRLYRSHSGGQIHSGMPGHAGLRNDETPRILQHGEYVVQKDAVRKYGAPLFESLNNMKMHVGGFVNPIATAAGGLAAHHMVDAFHLLIARAMMNNVNRGAENPMLPGGGPGGMGTSPNLPKSVGHALIQFVPNIIKALAGHHLPTTKDYVDSVLYRMSVEDASGNLTAVNKWDVNWQRGTPSVGLMQVIGPTFQGNAGPYKNTGPFLYGVSVDPTANIYAGIGHALGAYSKPFKDVMYQTGGYDNGGILPHRGLGINLSGTPEVVFNAKQWNTLDTLSRIGANSVNQLDNTAGSQYNVNVHVHGSNLDANDVADVTVRKLQMLEMRSNQKRRIGNG